MLSLINEGQSAHQAKYSDKTNNNENVSLNNSQLNILRLGNEAVFCYIFGDQLNYNKLYILIKWALFDNCRFRKIVFFLFFIKKCKKEL